VAPTEQSPFENITAVELIKEFPTIFFTPKFHHRVHNSKLQANTNLLSPVAIKSYLLETNFNIILRSKARFYK
jgi:hypothetical protein